MIAGASPGTSLISSVTTRAGAHAAASRPPLIADRCLRTQFISSIAAPLFSSALVDRLLLVERDARPRASASSDDAPPEIRHSTRSSARQALGELGDALRRRGGRPRRAPDAPPRRPRCGSRRSSAARRTRAARSRSGSRPGPSGASAGHSASTAAAIAPPALPAPSTSVRPFGGGGRNGAIVVASGKAAATAASNSERRKERGSSGVESMAAIVPQRPQFRRRRELRHVSSPVRRVAAAWRAQDRGRGALPHSSAIVPCSISGPPEAPALRHPVPPAARDLHDRPAVRPLHRVQHGAPVGARPGERARADPPGRRPGRRAPRRSPGRRRPAPAIARGDLAGRGRREANDATAAPPGAGVSLQPHGRVALGARRHEHRLVRRRARERPAERGRPAVLHRRGEPPRPAPSRRRCACTRAANGSRCSPCRSCATRRPSPSSRSPPGCRRSPACSTPSRD